MKSVYVRASVTLECVWRRAPTCARLNNRYAKRLQKRNMPFVSVSTVLCFWGLMFTRTTALRSHLPLSVVYLHAYEFPTAPCSGKVRRVGFPSSDISLHAGREVGAENLRNEAGVV